MAAAIRCQFPGCLNSAYAGVGLDGAPTVFCSQAHAMAAPVVMTPWTKCQLPSCTHPAASGFNVDGSPFQFCSQAHLQEAQAVLLAQALLLAPCPFPGCSAQRLTTVGACSAHLCVAPGCSFMLAGSPTTGGRNYCAHHMPATGAACSFAGCVVPAAAGAKVCEFHKCKYAGCWNAATTGTDATGKPFQCCSQAHALAVCGFDGCLVNPVPGSQHCARHTPSVGTSMCTVCRIAPVFVDSCGPTLFCSRSCKAAGQAGGAAAGAPVPVVAPNVCVVCGNAPVYMDNGVPTPFCSKGCRLRGLAAGLTGPPIPGGFGVAPAPVPTPGNMCTVCGMNPVYVDNGTPTPYCSKKCRNAGIRVPGGGGAIRTVAAGAAPGLYAMTTDPKGIQSQFTSKWLTGTAPSNIHVFEIVMPATIKAAFEAYKASKKGAPQWGHGGPGNTQRRFHGTRVTGGCTLSPSNPQFCTSTSCAVCNIGRSGFQVRFANPSGRLGAGLYFSSDSSKSDGYTSSGPQGFRYMFVVQVVCGKVHFGSASSPPAGFDSIVYEPPGSKTNDEVTVYRDDAAIPTHLILYK